MRHDEFCTYEQALKLKEVGFDWECYEFWSTDFYKDGTPAKIRKTKSKPKACVISEHNSMLDKMDSDLITAPTQAVAMRWLREVHRLYVGICPFIPFERWKFYIDDLNQQVNPYTGDLNTRCDEDQQEEYDEIMYESYESALSAGIDAALKLIRKDNNV